MQSIGAVPFVKLSINEPLTLNSFLGKLVGCEDDREQIMHRWRKYIQKTKVPRFLLICVLTTNYPPFVLLEFFIHMPSTLPMEASLRRKVSSSLPETQEFSL